MTKIFVWPKTILSRFLFDQKIFYWTFFLTKNFLTEILLNKNSFDWNFFWPKILFSKIFFTKTFSHQNFCQSNFFLLNILFDQQVSFHQQFFSTKNIYNWKYFFQIFKIKQLVLTLKQLNLVKICWQILQSWSSTSTFVTIAKLNPALLGGWVSLL